MFSLAEPTVVNQPVKMSSREIAALTGKRHDNVMADCRKMLEALNIQSPELLGDYQDERGRTYQEFLLDQDLTMTLVMGYSIPLRHKVAKRWRELENSGTQLLPQSLPEALRLAADLAEEKQRLQSHVNLLENLSQEQQGEIDNLKNLFKESMSTVKFCKMLNGVNVQQVNQYLEGRKWLYNESETVTRWRVASYARDRYMTEHQRKIIVHSGDEFIRYEPVLIRKGAQRLYELYLKGELPMKKTWDGRYTHDKDVRVAE